MRYSALRRTDGPISPAAARPTSVAESVEVGQYERGVTADVIDVVRAADHAVRVDQERVSVGVVDVGSAGPDDAVCRADRSVDIGQQGKGKSLDITEGPVFFRGVERRAGDGAVAVGKRFGTVTQCLALQRSTGCGGLRVPPQEQPTTAVVEQRHRVPVLIGQGERWRRGSRGQHGCNVARTPGPDRRRTAALSEDAYRHSP